MVIIQFSPHLDLKTSVRLNLSKWGHLKVIILSTNNHNSTKFDQVNPNSRQPHHRTKATRTIQPLNTNLPLTTPGHHRLLQLHLTTSIISNSNSSQDFRGLIPFNSLDPVAVRNSRTSVSTIRDHWLHKCSNSNIRNSSIKQATHNKIMRHSNKSNIHFTMETRTMRKRIEICMQMTYPTST